MAVLRDVSGDEFREHLKRARIVYGESRLASRCYHGRLTLAHFDPAIRIVGNRKSRPTSTGVKRMLRSNIRPPRSPNADGCRALIMLAASPNGLTEHVLTAKGITSELMVELVSAGLATTATERVRLSQRRTLESIRVLITNEGRRVLSGHRHELTAQLWGRGGRCDSPLG